MTSAIAPELLYLLAALALFGAAAAGEGTSRGNHRIALGLALAGVAAAAGSFDARALLFSDAFRVDAFSQLAKVLLAVGTALLVALCGELRGVAERHHREFYGLVFLCTFALLVLVSSEHLLVLYLSLELSSYCLYVLVALRRDRALGLSAGLSYFLVGIFASATMLLGIALLYATAHATSLAALRTALPAASGAGLGAVLLLSGLLFKLGAFPFHFWVADAYQGGADQVTAYIATTSKVAAIAVATRVVASAAGLGDFLPQVLVAASVASMTLGNLAAIGQQDLKRLLAYSTVAHAGYALMGIASTRPAGYAAALFYALSVLTLKLAAFAVVIRVATDGRNLRVADLAGLHRRSPLLALTLLVALLGLAGIPPTVGFTAKFLVFVAALEKGLFWLVLVGMANVVVSLYYYLLVIKAAYLLEPAEPQAALRLSPGFRALAVALVAAMLAGGLYPAPFLNLAEAAARALG